MTHFLAVIMTVHNRKEKTLQCLKVLQEQSLPNGYEFHLYLTNDGCTDGTPEAIRKQYPLVHIIDGDGSLFWNRGMWMAWDRASKDRDYDFYLWLNDDTCLYTDSLIRLLSECAKYKNKHVIVGSTCAIDNKNKVTYGGFGNKGLYTDISINHECRAINGNIVLIPQYAFKVLGKNDYRFRHALGDFDYGLRALEHKIPCITAIGIYGECDLHERPTLWMDPSQPIKKRWKNFLSPLGNNPFEFFYFKRKHFGLLRAVITFCSMWVHFFFPWFWIKCYKNYNG